MGTDFKIIPDDKRLNPKLVLAPVFDRQGELITDWYAAQHAGLPAISFSLGDYTGGEIIGKLMDYKHQYGLSTYSWDDFVILGCEDIPGRLLPFNGEWDPFTLAAYGKLENEWGGAAYQFVQMSPIIYDDYDKAVQEMERVYLGCFEDRADLESYHMGDSSIKTNKYGLIGNWAFLKSFIPDHYKPYIQ